MSDYTVQKERWLQIVGYEGLYDVSDCGRVLSWRGIKPRMLKAGITTNGYYHVILAGDKKKWNVTVHRLVAIMFLGERPPEYQVNHIDGNRLNNHLSNLEWVTRQENIQHAVDTNRIQKQEHHSQTVLSNQDVYGIAWFLANTKISATSIADLYAVSRHVIHSINRGKSWQSLLQMEYPIRRW